MTLTTTCTSPSLVLALLFLLAMSMTTSADPAVCPENPSMMGYSDWAMLQQDLDAVKEATNDPTKPLLFKICPNTTFALATNGDGNQGLYFLHAKDLPVMILRCGEDGFSSDNCVVTGGLHHVWIDTVGALVFQGITFEKAHRGSVWMGTGQTQVTFEDCVWKNNTHGWTEFTSTVCPNGCAAALGGQFGAATLSNCQFLDNQAFSGAVYGESMQYTFESCLFQGNKATGKTNEGQPAASAITMVDSTSNLSLSHCCFIENESNGPATVKVDDSARGAQVSRSQPGETSLTINKDNHFQNNTVTTYDDLSTPSCEDGIYTHADFVSCKAGTSDCCQATDECQEEEAGNRDISFESSSAFIRSLVWMTLVMGCNWMMMV